MPPEEINKLGPEWYHGGGERRSGLEGLAEPIQDLIYQRAHDFGISPSLLYHSVKYKIGENASPDLWTNVLTRGTPQEINIEQIERYKERRKNPEIRRKVESSYAKEPGALKFIADLVRGHLEDKLEKGYQPYVDEFNEPISRIAPRTENQKKAQQIVEKLGFLPAHQDRTSRILETLEGLRGNNHVMNQVNPYLQTGNAPISDVERTQFLDSVRHNVINPTSRRMTRHLLEDTLPKLMSVRAAQGNLHGGKTMELRNKLVRDFYEDMGDMEKRYEYQALLHGQTAAEKARERSLNTAQLATHAAQHGVESQLKSAGLESEAMGQQQMRGLMGAEALNKIGTQEQSLNQQEKDLAYQDFLRQQEGMMPEIERANAIYRGLNPPQTIASLNARQPQPSAESVLGNTGMGLSILNFLNKKNQRKGGRVRYAGGGLAEDMIRQKILGAMMQDSDSMTGSYPDVSQSDMSPPLQPQSQALEQMNAMREGLKGRMASLDAGNQDMNPMYAGLANMFFNAAASQKPTFAGRLGEGAGHVMPAYMAAQNANQENKKISMAIQKNLLDTYQKEHEHELQMKNLKDIAKLNIESKTGGMGPNAAKAKVLRDPNSGAFYHVTPEKAEIIPGSPNKTSSEELPVTIQTKEGIPETRIVDLESDKEKRTKEKDQVNSAIRFYTQGLRHIDKMDKYLTDVGPSGLGFDLNDRLMTGEFSDKGKGIFGGSSKARGTYKTVTTDLVNLAHKFQGREGSRSATALKSLQEAKPNVVNKSKAANQEIHNILRESFMIDLEAEKFRQKLINKHIKDYVATEALQKWEESNPFIMKDGKLVGFKHKPDEFLPEEYKTILGIKHHASNPKTQDVEEETEEVENNEEPTMEEYILEAKHRGLIA